MSSDEIDMGFYCNHKAIHMINADDRFVIYSPVIMNSEVLAYIGDIEEAKVLGISQDRRNIAELVRNNYTNVKETKEITPGALVYSLMNRQIDIAAIDVTKAVHLEGISFTPVTKEDYISYSLVVRQDLIDSKEFKDFIEVYNKTVEDLNDKETLISAIGMPESLWEMLRIKFIEL